MNKILALLLPLLLFSEPHPIQFSISETKMVKEIPSKDRDFAFMDPSDFRTYIYQRESDYYNGYQRSYFALTKMKGGWDCLRHYEILANGCIPYFLDLENCPPKTMALLPKKLILEAMHLPGVYHGRIDHNLFDKERYYQILNELLKYTRTVLTAKNMAKTILDTVQYTGKGKILFLTDNPSPDYLRCCTLIGFKELLGDRVIDVPKIEHIYTSYPHDEHDLYGKGFTYTKIVEDFPIDRENIEQRIMNREFDLIIYGSIHRGLRYYQLVRQRYSSQKILYLCGEDAHQCKFTSYTNLFLRENPY
ncbi:MAG TPA: hypothetical protein VLE89_04250 [Chlamydiales bacterium]|nr:hypothetical protein [Chlamydiales bacterium]